MASASPARRSAYSYPKVTAALEIAAYLSMTGIAAIAYTFGWLSLNQAGMCALLLVLMLVLLAWVRFDGGRHPCFLFLGIFPIFQAGHLIAYAMGALPDPFMVRFLAPHPFDITPDTSAVFLLVLCLAAICIYAPCRWNYQGVSPIRAKLPGSVLPYLYLVFGISLPFAILENVLYFRYASAHGGYLVLFTQRAALIASVPILIRAGSNLLTPAFLAIFVLESRRIRLYAATAMYFLASSFFLLIGSRGGTLTMILALWYISQIKRARRSRILPVAVFALLLIGIAISVGNLRESSSEASETPFSLASFIAGQGTTMSVTEIAIQYRRLFAPYTVDYFVHEIENAFTAPDQSEFQRGTRFADDVTVFLNPGAYSAGAGTGSSYLGEAYIGGGIPGIILASLLIGVALDKLHRGCKSYLGMFVCAAVLPSILWVVRAGMFDWTAAVVRTSLLCFVLYIGWKLYSLCLYAFKPSSGRGDLTGIVPLAKNLREETHPNGSSVG